MRWDISGVAIPVMLPNAAEVTRACAYVNVPPCLAYAIKWNETSDRADASTVLSADGGHGLFQLTSSYPGDWRDPLANAVYALRVFIVPAITFWNGLGFYGETLVRCVAAEFNAGRSGALQGHVLGSLDRFTTNDYAARALENYKALVLGGHP